MLVVYKTGAIRVTPKFTRMIVAGMFGVLVLMLGNFVLAMFGVGGGEGLGLRGGGPIAIIFSLVCIGLAAFSFLLDFDAADQMIRAGAPEKAAWGVALGLTVTLVWLYIEILRLLSYFNSDSTSLHHESPGTGRAFAIALSAPPEAARQIVIRPQISDLPQTRGVSVVVVVTHSTCAVTVHWQRGPARRRCRQQTPAATRFLACDRDVYAAPRVDSTLLHERTCCLAVESQARVWSLVWRRRHFTAPSGSPDDVPSKLVWSNPPAAARHYDC